MNHQHLDELNAMDKRLHELMHRTITDGEGAADEHDSITEALFCLHTSTLWAIVVHVQRDPRYTREVHPREGTAVRRRRA